MAARLSQVLEIHNVEHRIQVARSPSPTVSGTRPARAARSGDADFVAGDEVRVTDNAAKPLRITSIAMQPVSDDAEFVSADDFVVTCNAGSCYA